MDEERKRREIARQHQKKVIYKDLKDEKIKVGKISREKAFLRAEKYASLYRKAEAEEIRMGKLAKKMDKYYVPAEPKLAVVVRIRG